MSQKEIILIGGGGHCHSVIDVIENEGVFKIAGIVDVISKIGEKVCGYEIIASDDEISNLVKEYSDFHITIGQIKSPLRRTECFLKIKELGGNFPTIISKHAVVSSRANVGEGSIIMNGALINANSVIGKNCIINSNALIEHDCRVSNYCHISTGAILNGGVNVGESSFIGSGTVVNQEVQIGNNTIIGSGSVVIKNLSPDSVYVGNPARISNK